ncbi:uncharacterized protein LOC124709084 [Schistocerca piceifrons]|uniref:uncharacterized protein LOC124709084 n=1 Tax=Schistocerca piceifrons TaxID=274613 RepID=UPI001F5ECA29|nr:uncharacterized protein LOC124709084 [Schistocerca piceifrons]
MWPPSYKVNLQQQESFGFGSDMEFSEEDQEIIKKGDISEIKLDTTNTTAQEADFSSERQMFSYYSLDARLLSLQLLRSLLPLFRNHTFVWSLDRYFSIVVATTIRLPVSLKLTSCPIDSWCCCCFRLCFQFCRPVELIQVSKKYIADNPPGRLVLPDERVINYKPTVYEVEEYERFNSYLRRM